MRPGRSVANQFKPPCGMDGRSRIPKTYKDLREPLAGRADRAVAYRLIPELPEKLSSPGGVMPFSSRTPIAVSDDDDAPDDGPDLPTDEPQPAPVQDPPAEPDPAPYVVRAL